MRQLRLTPVSPTREQRTLFGASVPIYPDAAVAKGQRLRAVRLALNLTVREGARRLGIDAKSIEALERGEFDCDEVVAASMLGRHV